MFGPKTCIFDRALPLAMLCAHLVAVSPAWAGPAIKAADAIDPIGANAYEAGSLLDRDLRTAWCTKMSSAQPPWITIEYETPRPVTGIGWINGYTKDRRVYRNNARVKSVSAYADGRLLGRYTLSDSDGPQWLELAATPVAAFRFVIEDVYPGARHDDLCVTEIIQDRRTVEGLRVFVAMDESLGDRALTAPEIQESLPPLFEIYDSFFDSGRNLIESDRPFWDLIRTRNSRLDSPALRSLLNLRYYAERYRQARDAELLEGLRDSVIPFIESNPSVVASVLTDERQLMKETIVSAYVMFIDQFGTEDALRRYQAAHDDFRKLSEFVDSYLQTTD